MARLIAIWGVFNLLMINLFILSLLNHWSREWVSTLAALQFISTVVNVALGSVEVERKTGGM